MWSNVLRRKSSSVASPIMASASGVSIRSLIIRATLRTSSERSTSATALAPRSASSKATACPMPLAAPVTIAHFP